MPNSEYDAIMVRAAVEAIKHSLEHGTFGEITPARVAKWVVATEQAILRVRREAPAHLS